MLIPQRGHGLRHLRPRDLDVRDRHCASAATLSIGVEILLRRQRSASGTLLTSRQAIATYILLYLDQEVLSELTNVRSNLKAFKS